MSPTNKQSRFGREVGWKGEVSSPLRALPFFHPVTASAPLFRSQTTISLCGWRTVICARLRRRTFRRIPPERLKQIAQLDATSLMRLDAGFDHAGAASPAALYATPCTEDGKAPPQARQGRRRGLSVAVPREPRRAVLARARVADNRVVVARGAAFRA